MDLVRQQVLFILLLIGNLADAVDYDGRIGSLRAALLCTSEWAQLVVPGRARRVLSGTLNGESLAYVFASARSQPWSDLARIRRIKVDFTVVGKEGLQILLRAQLEMRADGSVVAASLQTAAVPNSKIEGLVALQELISASSRVMGGSYVIEDSADALGRYSGKSALMTTVAEYGLWLQAAAKADELFKRDLRAAEIYSKLGTPRYEVGQLLSSGLLRARTPATRWLASHLENFASLPIGQNREFRALFLEAPNPADNLQKKSIVRSGLLLIRFNGENVYQIQLRVHNNLRIPTFDPSTSVPDEVYVGLQVPDFLKTVDLRWAQYEHRYSPDTSVAALSDNPILMKQLLLALSF